ncbi:MAG: anhydro-N-acetylmuramic acid kinase [Salinivirgaceae bacterium]|nr:anhydro-N-acetylmuramic acid kinase [Salinivirgaceae bacterium]
MQDVEIEAIGIMSGTSLDGVDIVDCHFMYSNGVWGYDFSDCKVYPYTPEMLERLKHSHELNGHDLAQLDVDYGRFLGGLLKKFVGEHNCHPRFVASHGYTVFHEPQKGLTLQIGSGAHIAAVSGIDTICDFRTKDVAFGGNGAPLVPIGDKLLYGDSFDYCLNLGGFANISFDDEQEHRIAYDICPMNIVANTLTRRIGLEFDKGGELGRKGMVDKELLAKLNALPYYKQQPPKSLGREFVDAEILPLFGQRTDIENLLATYYQHAAYQISRAIVGKEEKSVLVTGGGAFNEYFIECLKNSTHHYIEIPSEQEIDFKEAIIFAFLGVLRYFGFPNCLKTVTGAACDNIGGAIYLAK